MKKIKTLLMGVVVTLIMLASLGTGVMIVGFAIVMGGVLALALKLGSADLWQMCETPPQEQPEDEDASEVSPA